MFTRERCNRSLFWVLLLVVAAGVQPADRSGGAAPPARQPRVEIEETLNGRQEPNPKIVKVLNEPFDFAGADDPKATLEDVLEKVGKPVGIRFSINASAFRAEMLMDVGKTKVIEKDPIPPMNKTTLGTVLKKILNRIPSTSLATYVVRATHVEITTQTAWLREAGLPADTTSPLIALTFRRVRLKAALEDVGREAGRRVLIDVRVEDKAKERISATLRHVPFEVTVKLLADMVGLAAVDVCGVQYVTTQANARRWKEKVVPRLKAELEDPNHWAGNPHPGFLNVPDGTLQKVLERLSDRFAVTILLDPRVKRQAQVRVDAYVEAPLLVALELVADVAGLSAVRLGNAYYVTSPDNATRLRREEAERLKAKKRADKEQSR